MVLNVNGYSDDFQKFVDFASDPTTKARNIARLSGGANGTPRTIGKTSSDGVGGFYSLFRRQGSVDANNATRTAFENSIAEIFREHNMAIPDSVRKQMKMEDFGKGKPLTARRILAVKASIDQHFTNVAAAKANATTAYSLAGPGGRAALDTQIATIIDSCSDDPELLALVTKHIDNILVAGNNTLRSAAAVMDRVDDLRANLIEIRDLSKKNPALKSMCLNYMDALRGKSVSQGLISKIVEAAKAAPIKSLTSMSASSSAWDIHRGVKQFVDNISNAIDSTGASRVLEGADELNPTRDLLETLIVSRFSKGTLQKIHDALESAPATKLLKLYENVMTGQKTDATASPGVKNAIGDQGSSYTTYIDRLKQAVDVANGIPANQVRPVNTFRGQLNMQSINGDAIFTDMVGSARSKLSRDRDSFINQTMQGDSYYAKYMRNQLRKQIPVDSYDAAQTLQAKASPCCFRMFNASVACDCKRFNAGNIAQTTFAKDLPRGFIFNLGGTRLSTDLNTAMNQVAQYVTKNPNATYAGLDPKTKATANLIMSMYGQEINKAAEFGFAKTFDPNLKSAAFMFAAKEGDHGVQTVSIEITSDHKLLLDFTGNREVEGFIHEGRHDSVGAGSQLHARLHVEIDADEFDRLASLDYSRLDNTIANRIEDGEPEPDTSPAPVTLTEPSTTTTTTTTPPPLPNYRMDPSKVQCMVDLTATMNKL